MNDQNPYSAPQTLDGAIPSENDWAMATPIDLSAVTQGARACLRSVYLAIFAVVAFILARELVPIGLLGMIAVLVVFVAAGVCHGLGLFLLQNIDPAARAANLFTTSLAFFLLGLVVNGIEIIWLFNMKQSLPGGDLVTAVLNLLANVPLMLGLLRVGRYLGNKKIEWNAKAAPHDLYNCEWRGGDLAESDVRADAPEVPAL